MSFFKQWFGSGNEDSARDSRRPGGPAGYRIDFEMMVKGSLYKRRSGMVRQFGVTVDGATRLVTSGDVVNRATYDALLVAGAIREPKAAAEEPAQPTGKTPKAGGKQQKAV